MPYFQQMTDQFRQMFGDDFVRNLMKSMQMPTGWPTGATPPATAPPGTAAGGSPQGMGRAAGPGIPGMWNPFGENVGASPQTTGYPPVDVYETKHEVIVIFELPGLHRAGDVRLAVYPDRLEVRGEIVRRYDGLSGREPVISERRIGSFERVVLLPSRVRKQHARAHYRQGLLEVRLIKEGKTGETDANVIDVDFL